MAIVWSSWLRMIVLKILFILFSICSFVSTPNFSLQDVENDPRPDSSLRAKKGFNPKQAFVGIPSGDGGSARIRISELERIELDLGQYPDGVIWSAGLLVGDELRPLPIGSTFDPHTGSFIWMPGPGFLGDFNLVFAARVDGKITASRKIKISISPQKYHQTLRSDKRVVK